MRLKKQHIALAVILTTLATLLILVVLWPKKPPESESIQSRRATIDVAERVGPSRAYPDPTRTPGFPNPDITQANISETICNPEWSTKSIRPPTSYTTKLKRKQIREWGLLGALADYEEDHFISLELGGSPIDPRNLWPEAYEPRPGAKEKDAVENYLHNQVCSGALTLEEAQTTIVRDWYSVYLKLRP